MNEIEHLITQYNIDSRNRRLREYYAADNIWRTLRIERDENRHSAFLSWLLEKDAFQDNSPLSMFLNLIVRRKDNEDSDFQELKKAVLLGRIQFRSVHFSVEKVISALSQIRFNDRIDIYAECGISGVNGFTKLEIFIENKIDATEGKSKVNGTIVNCTPEEENYKKLKQTRRYYYACSKLYKMRLAPFDPDRTIQLFVFLTSRTQDPAEKQFVTISYQDLVEYVLEPYMSKEDIDTHTSMAVNDYLRILGNPINKMSTMATTAEEKELLLDFYKRNEDLFKRALEVLRDTAETTEEKDNYSSMLDSIKKSRYRFFTINDSPKEYKMYEVVAEFVKYMLGKPNSETFETLEKIIKKYTKEKTGHVSTSKSNVKRPDTCFETSYKGTPFYVTKEWGKGKPGYNFDGFQTGVNQDYPDFMIQEV